MVARPPGSGSGSRRRSVEAKHSVVLFSGRVGRWYAHDPRVEEWTHTSQTPDAEVGGAPGVIVEGVGGRGSKGTGVRVFGLFLSLWRIHK